MFPLVEASHGQVRTPMAPHETSGQVGIWSDVRSGQHHVRCPPPQLKKSSGQGKMIDPLDDFYTTKDLLPGGVTIWFYLLSKLKNNGYKWLHFIFLQVYFTNTDSFIFQVHIDWIVSTIIRYSSDLRSGHPL